MTTNVRTNFGYEDPTEADDASEQRNNEGPRHAKLRAGLGGALALTAVHELGRRLRSDAPRMDVVGGRGLVLLCEAIGVKAPRGNTLFYLTMAADVLSNAAFYAACLSRGSRRPGLRASLTGAAAGYAAYKLPPLLGLGKNPRSGQQSNRAMTVAWYAIGGLVSAAIFARAKNRTPS